MWMKQGTHGADLHELRPGQRGAHLSSPRSWSGLSSRNSFEAEEDIKVYFNHPCATTPQRENGKKSVMSLESRVTWPQKEKRKKLSAPEAT